MKTIIHFIAIGILFFGCSGDSQFRVLRKVETKTPTGVNHFSLIENTSIDFQNEVLETEALNFLNFSNIYNGGGVATADFDNNGLVDVFLISNQQSNKLYLNQGNFEFQDATEASGLIDAEGWSTGVSVIDINNDGWLDIYICKSGSLDNNLPRRNKLYINQKNNTFQESAEKWNINDEGFSTQSYFFDFDKDEDLDMYLVNHRVDFNNTSRLNMEIERAFSRFSSDKLYRNDGNFFTEVTHKSGLVNKAWGLSASIGDFNNDNWPDVYVCNDFLTPDMLYINNKDGTFSNQILDRMNHISFSSMGSDYADINNDLLPDLLVLEMAAEDHVRSKENMATMNTKSFNNLVEKNYHYQYMVNTLQLNTTEGQFSEIAQLSGVAKTDWSWAPLIADFDNDGFKDIFITNGILKEMGNQDFRTNLNERFSQKIKPSFNEVTNMLPSNKLSNYSFKNNGDYTFSNTSAEWGFNAKTQSNGVAYADFDNDGDLDLVINNTNDKAQIYRNNGVNNFIQIRLKGSTKNTQALGSKVTITVGGEKQYQELYLSRGFLSTVQNTMNFGVGNKMKIEEILVEWPNQEFTIIKDVEANQIIQIDQKNSTPLAIAKKEKKGLLSSIKPTDRGITFNHKENDFDDYKNQILLPHSQSTNGPFIDNADVNNDGLDDFFVGGAADQNGELYIQTSDGNYVKKESEVWSNDKKYEDLGILFFDADSDGDQDLYVVSGGTEFVEGSDFYQDRLYSNDGKGNFTKSINALPQISSSGQCIKASDIDADGDIDLFVGGRVIPDKYPYAPKSQILINENGRFYNGTKKVAPLVEDIGMVTDALFSDFDNDGDEDLIVVGEWMPITIFENQGGKLELIANASIKGTEGIWFSIEGTDLDSDGDMDYFVGNLGLNSKFKASAEKPFHVFCDDFDQSGTYDIVLTSNYKGSLVPSRGRECTAQQMPFVKTKYPTFASFANASLEEIYGESELQKALHLDAKMLESIFLENLGNGEFRIIKLPKSVQISPIMDFEFFDINKDGSNEIIIVGNHYNSEVETARHDASYGAVLSYQNKKFTVNNSEYTGFFNEGNAKDIMSIDSKSVIQIVIANNNGELKLFEINRN